MLGKLTHIEHAWAIWSLAILAVWFIIFFLMKVHRGEMVVMSFITMPFGLTEPLFVPEYWNPPSLFDLAGRTGFDIESFIFSFSIGGIGAIAYKILVNGKTISYSSTERVRPRHKLHRWILLTPVFVFTLLAVFTSLGHIYCGIIALITGGLFTLYCRPDLKFKMWFGGLVFLVIYLIYFESLLLFYPDYVTLYYNLNELSGILILGIPLEEYLFAFSFGLYWSGLYEHMFWKKLIAPKK